MSEIDVLSRWRPGGLDPQAFDHESHARARLEAAMGITTGVVGPAIVRTPRAGRRFGTRALIAAAVAFALVAGVVVAVQRIADERAGRVRRVPVAAGDLDAPTGTTTNVLVVGSDSRAFVQTPEQAQAFGTADQEGGQRSDVMALVRIGPAGVQAVWLPRDLLVDDPAGGRRQLNSYFDDGPGPLIAAVRRLTGVPIEHFAQVDFAAFIGAVDAVGRVDVFVPRPVRDTYTGLDLPGGGCTPLDGNQALAWVRSRHLQERDGDTWVDLSPHGDLDRVARQQELVTGLAALARSRAHDLGAVVDLTDAVARHVTVDASMSNRDLERLAVTAWRAGEPRFATAPTQPDPAAPGRLDLVDRPPGADFVDWAIGTTTDVPAAAATTSGPPAPSRLGERC